MRIVLLHPPLLATNDETKLRALDDDDNSQLPIGLYSLAAVLDAEGHDVLLLNHPLTAMRRSVEDAAAFEPGLVGITCMTHQRDVTRRWAEAFREKAPGVPIILGGVHASLLPQAILERWPAIDYIAVGEAERSLAQLVRALETGGDPRLVAGIASRNADGSVHWPGPAEAIADLGDLPIAARFFAYQTIATSRGCPFQCAFCSSPQIWGSRVRERPVEHVIEELTLLRRTHGLTQLMFKDETFTARRSRVEAICRGIIEAGLDIWWSCDTRVDCIDEERLTWMRRAGCFYVSFGVESGSPRMLDAMNKKASVDKVRRAAEMARRFGMLVRFYLIAGLPDETDADLRATLDLVRECRPHFVHTCSLALLPGTAVFEEYCRRTGASDALWFDTDADILLFDSSERWRHLPAGRALAALNNISCRAADNSPHYPLTEDELRHAQQAVPDAMTTNYDLALFLNNAGRYDEAIPFYENVLEIRPHFAKARLDIGSCHQGMGRLDEAIAHWTLINTMPVTSAADTHNHMLALLYRAMARLAMGESGDEAFDLLERARKTDLHAPDPLRALATEGARLGRWDNAGPAAQEWATLEPEAGDAWHIAALSEMREGHAQDAQIFFQKALDLKPDAADLRFHYASLLAQAGALSQALEHLARCLTLAPEYAPAQDLANRIKQALGQRP